MGYAELESSTREREPGGHRRSWTRSTQSQEPPSVGLRVGNHQIDAAAGSVARSSNTRTLAHRSRWPSTADPRRNGSVWDLLVLRTVAGLRDAAPPVLDQMWRPGRFHVNISHGRSRAGAPGPRRTVYRMPCCGAAGSPPPLRQLRRRLRPDQWRGSRGEGSDQGAAGGILSRTRSRQLARVIARPTLAPQTQARARCRLAPRHRSPAGRSRRRRGARSTHEGDGRARAVGPAGRSSGHRTPASRKPRPVRTRARSDQEAGSVP